MNGQPWHFSVVTNKEILEGIFEKMKANMPKRFADDGEKSKAPPEKIGAKAGIGDSPLAIIVSAKDGSDFDAGLAAQLMSVEAFLLGYGTKIISSPNIVLNGTEQAGYKALLGIPHDMSSKGIILIGKYNQAESDAITRATTRKAVDEVVSFIKELKKLKVLRIF